MPPAPDKQPELSDLIHLYEVTVNSMNAYYTQVWERFNWFLTLQAASFGFYFSSIPSNFGSRFGVPLLGGFLSLLWLLMGIEDFRSAKKHDTRMTQIRKLIYDRIENLSLVTFHPRKRRIFHQNWLLFGMAIASGTIWAALLLKPFVTKFIR